MSHKPPPEPAIRPTPPEKLNRIPIFYTPLMAADADSFLPGAAKPAVVVESWLKLGLPLDIISPEPVSTEDLSGFHHAGYSHAAAFCVFNSLLVTAMALHDAGEAQRFLASIPALVTGMKDCDVIPYQAGADPHIDDPPGRLAHHIAVV